MSRCEYSAKDVMGCIDSARRNVDELVGRTVATLGEDATEDLRAVAKLARALDDNLDGATVMLDEMKAFERERASKEGK